MSVAVFGDGFADVLLRALDTPPDILADATAFAKLIIFAISKPLQRHQHRIRSPRNA